MSRTKKGKKSPGYDFWGKRAMSGSCGFGNAIDDLREFDDEVHALWLEAYEVL